MSSKRRTSLFISLLFLFLAGFVVGNYLYKYLTKPPAAIEEQSAVFSGSAAEFQGVIGDNAEKWQGAIINVKGRITELGREGAMLDESIFCQFKDPGTVSTIHLDQVVKLKARFIGYDDLLEEIKLDQCIVVP